VTRTIPLFPLPSVVLLPETLLPLHVFEARYRAMVEDALATDRTIGLAMLRDGRASDEGASPIHPIGGAGEIVESERLEDGRFNILVQGRFRYRILGEEKTASAYRVARVEELESVPFASSEEAARMTDLARKLFDVVRAEIDLPPLPQAQADAELTPERLASELALRLRYEPAELQAMLETNSLPARFATLVSRLIDWQRRIQLLEPFRPSELDVTRN
jgi:Lon protease-like protein